MNTNKHICIYDNCKELAYFNYQHKSIPIFCWFHKLKNMIDITKRT